MSRMLLMIVLAGVACTGKSNEPGITKGSPTEVFWKWFVDHAGALRADKDVKKTTERIAVELEKVKPGVIAELVVDGENRTLVLNAGGNQQLFSVVQGLRAARPMVEGWTIVGFRERATSDNVMSFFLDGNQLDARHVRFAASPVGPKVEIEIFLPGVTTADELARIEFVILDRVVGDYDMGTRIAGVDFAPLDKAPAEARALVELPTVIDAME